MIILIIIDCGATMWAINTYQNRVVQNYFNVEVKKQNNIKQFIEDKLFSNEIMKKTFPNLRYIDENGTQYYLKDMIN